MAKDFLLEQALNAVDNLFSDSSVPLETTLDRLEQVQTEVELRIEMILGDIQCQQGE